MLNFGITNDTGIKLYFPKESELIEKFDDIKTVYFNGTKEILLSEENLNETILSLKNMLTKALNGQLSLHPSIEKFKVGLYWNQWTNALSNEAIENEDDYFERHWLWSTNEIQTWVYNVGSEIYLEISPS